MEPTSTSPNSDSADTSATSASTATSSQPTIAELDRQTEKHWNEIEAASKAAALTSTLQPVSILTETYKEAPHFLAGIASLQESYSHIRTVRGDGNCYYRAVLYSLAQDILDKPAQATHWLKWLEESWKKVLAAGYDEMTLEVFYDTMVELIEKCKDLDGAALHKEMNEENSTSDYCTWYLRVVTAVHLKSDPARFLPFIEQMAAVAGTMMDIQQFCQREVEPMGKECEQVQVLALAEAMGVQVGVAYLDGHSDKPTQHFFGDDTSSVKMTLLYRPGHYDILYAKTA